MPTRRSLDFRRARAGSVLLTGAQVARVRQTLRILGAKEVDAAVRRYLAGRLNLGRGDMEVRAVRMPQQKIAIPRGKLTLSVEAPPKTRFIGPTPLMVIARRGAREVRRFWVSADVAAYTQVPAPRQPIRARCHAALQPTMPMCFTGETSCYKNNTGAARFQTPAANRRAKASIRCPARSSPRWGDCNWTAQSRRVRLRDAPRGTR